MEDAPFLTSADGPKGGFARWLTTDDGVRIRIAVWPKEDAKGTVLIFPGRTEYAEKYGRVARAMADRGYAALAIDWRGQGYADRLTKRTIVGHVGTFTDYQRDITAVMEAVTQLGLPEPLYLLAHSMGGCIGLRALTEGLPVNAAAFSAPMWDIQFDPGMKPLVKALSKVLPRLGLATMLAPTTPKGAYVIDEPFEDNTLTRDRDQWDYMVAHAREEPIVHLGGPSVHWLREAFGEIETLKRRESPTHPAICWVGSGERIVDPAAIHDRMERWPNGALHIAEGAEHEITMELPDVRTGFFDAAAALYAANA
ncbi:MAG: alpha/beta fold hydrolase [Shimia sp.]